MIDSNNQPFTILNPYTYAELRSFAKDLQSYVECLSNSYSCSDANVPVFRAQGVTLTNVLVKCRENYVKAQWDPKAYVYFDVSSHGQFAAAGRIITPPTGAVKDCLLTSHEQGAGPEACMEQYIQSLNLHTAQVKKLKNILDKPYSYLFSIYIQRRWVKKFYNVKNILLICS